MNPILKTNDPWAMRKDDFSKLLGIMKLSISGESIPEEESQKSFTTPSGIRIIPIRGTLFRYDNCWTEYGYGVSYDTIYREIDAAISDSGVKEILFLMDSPGGEAAGCAELSDYIIAKREIKPIMAHISGMAASAAYWIASSALKITGTRTSYAGSIGCIATAYDMSEYMKMVGVEEIVFVSSVSPDKYADLSKSDGRALIQKHVDEFGKIFVDNIAVNRNTSPEIVIEQFGSGDVLIANQAKASGMIDDIVNLEELISGIYESRTENGGPSMLGIKSEKAEEKDKEVTEEEAKDKKLPKDPGEMPEDGDEESKAQAFIQSNPKLASKLISIGAAKERARIKEIEEVSGEYSHNKELVSRAKFQSSMTAGEFLVSAVREGHAKKASVVNALNEDAQKIPELDATKPVDKMADLEQRAIEHAKTLNGRRMN